MHLDELEGQVRLQCVHHSTRAAITRRAHNFQRLERRDINIGQQMFNIGPLGIRCRQLTPRIRCGEVIDLG